ncbi:cupin domain-containing protein [candidate division KSB1 bacterium]|nr:cupin domain-containing protein [candidate division KSB1 bacterium]
MNAIKIDHHPGEETLQKAGIRTWPIWTKEESEFDWYYDSQETCYFLEGDVTVTPKDGEPVEIHKGDLVIFPVGMSCTWKVKKAVRKHYQFE